MFDAASYIMGTKGGGGGGGGDTAVLKNDLTSSVNVGGISAGKRYTAGTPLETVLRDMLSPSLNPTLTGPSATISGTGEKLLEKGTTQNVTLTISFSRGSISPPYGTSGYRSGAATGYSVNGGTVQSGNTFSVEVSGGSRTFSGRVNYAAGEQPKDSTGADYGTALPAGYVTTSSLAYEFVLPFWYGVSATNIITDFTGFTKELSKKENKVHRYDTVKQYAVFAYDASYGDLKSILDPNGFDYISGFTKSTVNVGGNDYLVYVAEYPTTDTGFEYRFNFS